MKRRLNPLKATRTVAPVGSVGSSCTPPMKREGRALTSSWCQVPPKFVAIPRAKPALLQFEVPHQPATIVPFLDDREEKVCEIVL